VCGLLPPVDKSIAVNNNNNNNNNNNKHEIRELKKTAILGTAHILWKVLT
jgi:hypothetical protein